MTTPKSLLEALAPLRNYLLANQMAPDQVAITLAPDDYLRLLHILSQDIGPLTRGHVLSGHIDKPILYFGFKISSNYDNRLPTRVMGGDD